ncbi:putative disease resistance protein At1g50180 [Salvia miltiorrhiza]|uniref:putative disease resistance protein At1g50180 n=1 Tax=Salvia miltiorrhiza TaxID=226208 RepID=UPI0025AC2293|nr:putative disease resistance protein At1g50180 [Salvia miltiorrhiza]
MAAEAAISSLVELLGNLLIQKVEFLRDVEGKVELLREELKRMQSFLKDANKKQFEEERVRNWISSIRELAQDAQDTIEIFLLNIESAKNWGLLKRCTSSPKRMYHLDKIGDEIESIRDRLDAIDKSRERYGINDLGEAAESASRWEVESRRRLIPWQKDEHLVGVKDDVEKLLHESILCEEKKGLSIAVLEGMGGIGKSTFSREIYNHPDVVSGPFDHRGWVVVSSEFTPRETIKQLIFELQKSKEDKQKLLDEIKKLEESMKDKQYLLQKLKEMLHKQLEGKSYLIVLVLLDDVWEKEHLESLITVFPDQQDKASRLLVTTRNKIITKYDQYVHKMSLLDSKKSWELLLKKAFIGSTIGKCPDEFESVGTQILQKCKGLPLAISMVGGLLRQTPTKNGWEQVLIQLNSYLGRTESGVSTILELSYQNLSPQLKSCFLCLAFFKKDFTIRTKRLVKLWDAQGLIQQEESRSIDEIGRGYLNELINRSMVQIQDLHVNDQVKSCHIHNLVRDVCLRKAKEEIGLEIVKGDGEMSSESSNKPRHRVVYAKNIETSSSNQNKHVRSIFLLNLHDEYRYITTISHYWKGYRLLKTVELEATAFERFPNSFRLLIGLKCLRMYTNYRADIKLPDWFDHLRNLEVVDMESCRVYFPRLVSLKMDKLRYFISAAIGRGPTNKNMWNKNIECLIGIRHKDWMKSTLTSSCHLRELGILLDRIKREELIKARASLEKMQNLVILHLKWWYAYATEIALVVPQLANLTKLKLEGKMSKCPSASMFPPNLSHLTLTSFQLHDDPMAELGKLPKLLFLKLQYEAFVRRVPQPRSPGFSRFGCEERLHRRRWNAEAQTSPNPSMPQSEHWESAATHQHIYSIN